MANGDKDRDPGWDAQAKLVDRLIRKLRHGGSTLAPAAAPAVRAAGSTGAAGPAAPQFGRPGVDVRRFARAGSGPLAVWAQVALAVIFGVALTQWPYERTCDWSLLFYLIAVSILIVAGLWAALSSWKHRVGLAHLIAMGAILWGLVLAADEVLPRVGYAKTPATWTCARASGASAVPS